MADGDGDLEDWTPDKEKEDDPRKLQKEAIRLQKEGLALMRGELEKRKVAVGPPEFVGVMEFPHAGPPPQRQVTLQVRKIQNGFLLALTRESNHGYGVPAEETFYQTVPELLQGLEGVVQGAFPPPAPHPGGLESPPDDPRALRIPDGT